MKLWFTLLSVLYSLQCSRGSPIVDKLDSDYLGIDADLDKQCYHLPGELDGVGLIKYFEDCESLKRFTVPIPAYNARISETVVIGVHPKVCCPRVLKSEPLCFPSDVWCVTHKEKSENLETLEYDDDVGTTIDQRTADYNYYDYDYTIPSGPEVLLSNEAANCAGLPDTVCTAVSRCDIFNEVGPTTLNTISGICSFDETKAQMKVCCPPDKIRSTPAPIPAPRFPKDSRPRECEDRSRLCERWNSNGACALNQTFLTSKEEPQRSAVTSAEMFKITTQACLKSCKRCGDKGCVDELPQCQEWARKGNCASDLGFFMSHTCRESCGVCGFLSPFSTEEQKTADGKSYSNLKAKDFDCGRFKSNAEIDKINEVDVSLDLRVVSKRQAEEGTKAFIGDIFCGATAISDRWLVSAAHCFSSPDSTNGQQTLVQTFRTQYPSLQESIEVRNIYIHPNYQYGKLYGDIALLELGKRLLYNYDQFGDSPACLDSGLNLDGRIATVQGYGKTESGTRGELLEANTTIIGYNDCNTQIAKYLTEQRSNLKLQFCNYFPYGLTEEQICAQGEKFVYDGDILGASSCKGDSGGPLFVKDDEGKTYLAGIVSGSLSCDGQVPESYTRYSSYRDWTNCIMTRLPAENFNKDKVEKICLLEAGVLKRDPSPICADSDSS